MHRFIITIRTNINVCRNISTALSACFNRLLFKVSIHFKTDMINLLTPASFSITPDSGYLAHKISLPQHFVWYLALSLDLKASSLFGFTVFYRRS